jgi:hypothetical protein
MPSGCLAICFDTFLIERNNPSGAIFPGGHKKNFQKAGMVYKASQRFQRAAWFGKGIKVRCSA